MAEIDKLKKQTETLEETGFLEAGYNAGYKQGQLDLLNELGRGIRERIRDVKHFGK